MIGLVYLVWAPLGAEPVTRFLDGYRRCLPGVEHELVVVLKGFTDGQAPDACRALLAATDHREIVIDCSGQDLASYARVAELLDHDQLCLCNSHARPLADGWLSSLEACLDVPGVGLVGATATYESHVQGAATGGGSELRMLWLRRSVAVRRARRDFPSFPNPHVRTNALLIERGLLLELGLESAVDKAAALRLESGWGSVTRQVQARGLAVLVAGRDGSGYGPEQWPASHTFRSGEQENLLVADRRTDEYAAADPERRRELVRLAWGEGPV